MPGFAPTTRPGRLACWLAVGFAAWFLLNEALMNFLRRPIALLSWVGLALGLGAGVMALVAILRQRERGTAVFLSLFPGAFVLVFLAGELVGGP